MAKKTEDAMARLSADAAALYAADKTVGRRRLVAALGCTGWVADKILQDLRSGKPVAREENPALMQVRKAPGISVKEFGSRFDYESKLRGVLRELCRDRFVSDADIRERCDIPIPAFRTVAGLPEFQACQIKDRGTVYWSLKGNVDEVRQQARRWGISK